MFLCFRYTSLLRSYQFLVVVFNLNLWNCVVFAEYVALREKEVRTQYKAVTNAFCRAILSIYILGVTTPVYHGCCYFPSARTEIRVINGYFPSMWTEMYEHIFSVFCPPGNEANSSAYIGYFPSARTEIYSYKYGQLTTVYQMTPVV